MSVLLSMSDHLTKQVSLSEDNTQQELAHGQEHYAPNHALQSKTQHFSLLCISWDSQQNFRLVPAHSLFGRLACKHALQMLPLRLLTRAFTKAETPWQALTATS
jgi:hypothetical protein